MYLPKIKEEEQIWNQKLERFLGFGEQVIKWTGKVQGLSQLRDAMGDSTEMLFYWKKRMESFKAVSAEQQWRKKLKPKKKEKKMKTFLVWGRIVFIWSW